MQRRAITILTCMVSANHWYAEDKFYRGINSCDTGSAAELTTTRKLVKYEDLSQRYAFVPRMEHLANLLYTFYTNWDSAQQQLHKSPEKLVFSFNICLSLFKDLMLFVSLTLLSLINC